MAKLSHAPHPHPERTDAGAEGLPLRSGVAFHHVASVRELAKGEFPPGNNLVPGRIPVGHYGPYLVALGWIARLTGAEPMAVLQGAGMALLLAYLLAFHALAARLVSPAAAAWSVPAASPCQAVPATGTPERR